MFQQLFIDVSELFGTRGRGDIHETLGRCSVISQKNDVCVCMCRGAGLT